MAMLSEIQWLIAYVMQKMPQLAHLPDEVLAQWILEVLQEQQMSQSAHLARRGLGPVDPPGTARTKGEATDWQRVGKDVDRRTDWNRRATVKCGKMAGSGTVSPAKCRECRKRELSIYSVQLMQI